MTQCWAEFGNVPITTDSYRQAKKSKKMEENLLASILRTNEKIQECLNQDMSDIFLGSDLEVGNNYQALNAQQKAKTQPRQSQEQQKENATESNNKTQTQPDDSLLDERYIVSIIGVKQRKSEGTMTKQFYIVYEISITRIVDGVTRSVFRRFKEIRAFYQDVTLSHPPPFSM